MNAQHSLLNLVLVVFLAIAGIGMAWAEEPAKMKMTTEVPEGVATPDRLDTSIGTLNFSDGIPDETTVQKVYDNLDFQRGVQAYLP